MCSIKITYVKRAFFISEHVSGQRESLETVLGVDANVVSETDDTVGKLGNSSQSEKPPANRIASRGHFQEFSRKLF